MSLNKSPAYFRAKVARGSSAVVRDGGDFGFGLISQVSVITRGEALGHDMWVDGEFLDSTVDAINSGAGGVKARFTHPGLSSDGVGQKLGRVSGAYRSGDQVYADLHIQEAATKTPDGDLADYVMTLAEETPEDFGLSIVFENDNTAMEQHYEDNSNTRDGKRRFVSPDEDNEDNYPHARLSKLRAADVVDSPAANPDGLFKRGQEAAQDAEAMLSYAFGLSEDKPECKSFDIDGDRVHQFFARFLERNSLTIQKGGTTVSETKPEAASVPPESPTLAEFTDQLDRYVSAFGAECGVEWFKAGVSYEDAQANHIESLSKEIALLNAKIGELEEAIQSIDLGEESGGEFGDGDDVQQGKQKTFAHKLRIQGQNAN